MYSRIIVLVIDSVGIGYMPDAFKYNDEGANTLIHIAEKNNGLNIPTLNSLGIGDLAPIKGTYTVNHKNSYCYIAKETSNAKDTMAGHWEMMGVNTVQPFISFTDTGFPKDLIDELEKRTGHKIIGNIAASGTEIIKELGEQQLKDKSLIVYTSADSVLQIAAHEEAIGLEELYRCCQIARDLCMDPKYKVGRVIARPYIGTNRNNFIRTSNRHDYSVTPPVNTVLNLLKNNNLTVSGIGKINDIFAGSGITQYKKIKSNIDGMNITIDELKNEKYKGLCFINLVEFDSEYGHRRNPLGYAKCLEEFDNKLKELLPIIKDDELLIITADHGNDPTWTGSDHTREKVPVLLYSPSIKNGKKLEERDSFADIGATILENFKIKKPNYLLGTPIKEVL